MSRMYIHLATLTFDAAGQGEKTEYDYRGHYEERGSERRLLWQKEEEGSITRTVISFFADTPDAVCMRETGAREATLHFAAGKEQTAPYRIPGVGELELTVRTERVENTLSPMGGRLRLAYEGYFGGVRQRIILTLTASPDE